MIKKIKLTDVIIAILSLLLCIGAATFFQACGPKDDGSWMNCHWAEVTVVSLGAVMTAQGIARFFVAPKIRIGLDISHIAISVLTAVVPGILIPLCMMNTMHCHMVFRPAVIVVSVLIAAVSVADMILQARSEKKVTEK